MKKITTTLFASLILSTVMFGQNQTAVTETGKNVILYPNGTWKYEEVKKDTSKTTTGNCDAWISTTTDKVTGETSTGGRNTMIVSSDGGKTGFGIYMMNGSKAGLILTIQAVGAGSCIDEGSKINILFVDGSRLTLKNDGDFNCKGEATVYFKDVFGKEEELSELKSKKIATMRVWVGDNYVEKNFSQKNKDEFFNTINCLTK